MKLTHKFAEMTPEKRPQDPQAKRMLRGNLRYVWLIYSGVVEAHCWSRRPGARELLTARTPPGTPR